MLWVTDERCQHLHVRDCATSGTRTELDAADGRMGTRQSAIMTNFPGTDVPIPGTPADGGGMVPYPWEHQPVPGSGVVYPWETNPNAPTWTDWNSQHGGVNATPATPVSNTGTTTSGGTQPWNPTALKWLGATVLLWIVLSAMTEYSDNAKVFGQAFAGLILMGALYALGPQAIANIPNLWKAPGSA
jgi:hypothetical protein